MGDANYRGVIVAAGGLLGCVAIGVMAGGWIYHNYANDGWLYLASLGIGIGAFLVAASFRPSPKQAGSAAHAL